MHCLRLLLSWTIIGVAFYLHSISYIVIAYITLALGFSTRSKQDKNIKEFLEENTRVFSVISAVYYFSFLGYTVFNYEKLSDLGLLPLVVVITFPLLIAYIMYDVSICIKEKTNRN